MEEVKVVHQFWRHLNKSLVGFSGSPRVTRYLSRLYLFHLISLSSFFLLSSFFSFFNLNSPCCFFFNPLSVARFNQESPRILFLMTQIPPPNLRLHYLSFFCCLLQETIGILSDILCSTLDPCFILIFCKE